MWNWNYTNVNNEFFKEWSNELAYVIGFFFADGSISNYEKYGKKYVQFACNDKDIIQKIADVCGYKNKVLTFKNGLSRISFAGDFIWNFFNSLGFDNNKTYNAKVPVDIIKRQCLHNHFIRGVFDGDGSLCTNKKSGRRYPSVNIIGTENLIRFIAKEAPTFNGFYKCKHSIAWRINYNGYKALSFLNYIYGNSNIYMDRKYTKYRHVKNWESSCVRWSKEEIKVITEKYRTTYAKDLSVTLNRSILSIVSKANKLGLKRFYSNGKI